MSPVCVALFVFTANDKLTSQKQMKEISIMLIETISLRSEGDWALLEKKRKYVLERILRQNIVQQPSAWEKKKKKSVRHNFEIMADILVICCILLAHFILYWSYFIWPQGSSVHKNYCWHKKAELNHGNNIINFCSKPSSDLVPELEGGWCLMGGMRETQQKGHGDEIHIHLLFH